MKTFDWTRFKDQNNKIVVHCKTEEEANDFCMQMDKHGMKWNTGDSYIENNRYVNGDIYYGNNGFYDTVSYAFAKYEILEWSDYMGKEFTKADLKTGMIVTLRDGNECVVFLNGKVIKNYGSGDVLVNSSISYWLILDNYNNDLTNSNHNKNFDIMRVELAEHPYTYMDINYGKRELLWEREEVKEMTMAELEEHFGCKIKIIKE